METTRASLLGWRKIHKPEKLLRKFLICKLTNKFRIDTLNPLMEICVKINRSFNIKKCIQYTAAYTHGSTIHSFFPPPM